MGDVSVREDVKSGLEAVFSTEWYAYISVHIIAPVVSDCAVVYFNNWLSSTPNNK